MKAFDRNIIAVKPPADVAEPVTVKALDASAKRHHQGAAVGHGTHRAAIGVEGAAKDRPRDPEHIMWVNVLRQALEDATGNVAFAKNNEEAEHLQAVARVWFQSNRRDFRDVCLLAGFDPDVVRTHALRLIERSDNDGNVSFRRRKARKVRRANRPSAFVLRLCASTALTPVQRAA